MDEGVLDMLNTRYLIRFDPTGQPVAELRATANGPAWFVQEVVDADTPQKEIDALGRIDTKTAAVINTREFDIRPLDRRRRGNPSGVSTGPTISGTNTRPLRPVRRSLLGDLLQGRLDSLYRRHRNSLFPSRLPAAGNGAPGRYAHGRMAVPRPRLERRRRRDARLVARDSRRHHCNRYTSFYAMKDDKRLKRKVRNSYIVSNISIALVLFLLGSVGYLMTAAMQVARTLQESVTVTVELRNGADEKQKKNRSANGSKPTSW